ncbi:U-box domain-containing protein 13 [Apostasia shenzhenica]|uniref:RING-type E3 ubiquitin transferase n=1 Tax=Apostasia shenzhenica TaxID=1088818 RepID=A0A2I0A8S1_9ASPA|nr:U-box domain-containing protein 13 [Apostasia shenzhenica]
MKEDEEVSQAVAAAAGRMEGEAVVQRLVEAVEEIAAISDFRNAYKKQFCNLSRRIRLLAPMFEELRDSREPISEGAARSLARLGDALDAATGLLQFGSDGSKICLVLERDKITKRFQEVTAQLEQALDGISFDKLDISDEVREQVELVHAQFKRAKERVDIPDAELYGDLSCLYDNSSNSNVNPEILARLAAKLQLNTISDLTQESLALHEMVTATGDPERNIEKMSILLKKIKDYVQTQNPEMGTPKVKAFFSDGKQKAPIIPDDFRCPISLDLMKDPVIVATGQTYDRACIEKWLDAGNDTCPKTQQKLQNTTLTPNYVLRSLIAQWCEANGIEPPQRPAKPAKQSSACSPAERANIDSLIRKLTSPNAEDQRSAAGELRLLAKRHVDYRIFIADAGAIPLLVGLLSSTDPRIQEHAVTTLLNLSIYDENKGLIVSSSAIPGIIHVLRSGSMEARENAAATLFSLSVVDENKITIGASGAIPALVSLLGEGSQRGKKDAATALFNLCIYQGNKARAVWAGVVPILLNLVMEPTGSMVDESLAILAILSSHSECKAAIGALDAAAVLIEVIRSGSPRNKENAAAVLLHLCTGEQQQQHLAVAQEQEVMGPLIELASSGTHRGKRKAVQLLERMTRFLEQKQQQQALPPATFSDEQGVL